MHELLTGDQPDLDRQIEALGTRSSTPFKGMFQRVSRAAVTRVLAIDAWLTRTGLDDWLAGLCFAVFAVGLIIVAEAMQ